MDLGYTFWVRRFWPLAVFCLLLGADQALKLWTVAFWSSNGWPVADATSSGYFYPVIPQFLDFHLTYNTGAAWSLFSGAALPLAILRLLAGIAILVYILVAKVPSRYRLIFSMIAAGAAGNAIDGLYQGKVTDMLYSHWLTALMKAINIKALGTSFPIFNIADSCVVVGTVALLIFGLFEKKPEAASKSNKPSAKVD